MPVCASPFTLFVNTNKFSCNPEHDLTQSQTMKKMLTIVSPLPDLNFSSRFKPLYIAIPKTDYNDSKGIQFLITFTPLPTPIKPGIKYA